MLGFCAASPALAQGPSPKVIVWNPASPAAGASYGIVGEIVHPGVYTSAATDVTLQQLIQRAGGFSHRGSPAVRIIRGGRPGQTVFFTPDGRHPLAPNDLVVVDPIRDPRQPLAAPVPERTDRNVWVGLVGFTDRPQVVWVNPEQANLANIMVMLGQDAKLAGAVQPILPPSLSSLKNAFELLPNGAVLVLQDRSLLVSGTLPRFPDPLPMTEPALPLAAASSGSPAPPPAPSDLPPLPTEQPAMPVAGGSSLSRPQVDATTVPFTIDSREQLPAA
jgi:hypothetical protein